MGLFKLGEFIGAAGMQMPFKIECDALDDEDWACIAADCASKITFGEVHGVPIGGEKLAAALQEYADPDSHVILIVDDVWTTGKSMRAFAVLHMNDHMEANQLYAMYVAFNRSYLPPPQLEYFMTL